VDVFNRERAERLLRETGADILVATAYPNVVYLSGYRPFSQRFLPVTQVYALAAADDLARPVVIAPIGDADMYAQAPPAGAQMRFYGTFYTEPAAPGATLTDEMARFSAVALGETHPSALAALTAELDRRPADARIAVDERGILPAAYAALRQRYGERILPGADLLDRIRMVKTPEEIRRLTRAAEAAEASVAAALAAARPGMTEAEMATVFDKTTIEQGCRPVFTVIAFGERASLPNAVPSAHRRLAPGDLIRFDVGCRAEGYASDISRTAAFRVASARQRAYHAAILAGEDAALAAIRPGAAARDVFAAAVRATRAAGIPHYRRHHVGHGIGLDVYDRPTLNATDETVLEPGMVLEVETPYYEIGFGGLQVEDTVVVTETGYRMLTRSPRELRIVP
jgi:Xaa-Pro dipeptidase